MSSFTFTPGQHVIKTGGRRGVVVELHATAPRARVLWTCYGSGELIEPAVRTWVRFSDLALNHNTAEVIADTARHLENVAARAAAAKVQRAKLARVRAAGGHELTHLQQCEKCGYGTRFEINTTGRWFNWCGCV